MTENEAVIKIIAKHTKEYNVLLSEHNVLLKVHVKTVNDFVDKCMAFDKLKSDNKELTEIIVRWERENGTLQESLDACQRELLEVENARAFTVEVPDSWIIKDEDLGEGG